MRRTNVILWTIQGLLALAFLFAGTMKLLTTAMITLSRASEATAPAILGILAIIVVYGRRRS